MDKLKLPRKRRRIITGFVLAIILYFILVAIAQYRIGVREVYTPQQLADQEHGSFYVVSGADIYYEYIPAVTERKGTLVLLHGFTDNLSSWFYQTEILSQNHDLILIDLPGFGLSQNLGGKIFSLDEMAYAVSVITSYITPQPVTLIGHSMGGSVAMRMGLDYPDMVDSIVLIDSADLSARNNISSLQWLNSPLFAQLPAGIMLDRNTAVSALESALAPTDEDAVDRYYRSFQVQGGTYNLINHTFAESTDRNSELNKLEPRVLIMHAKDDPIISIKTPQYLLTHIGLNAQTALLETGGHNPHQADPIVVNQLLLDWLDAPL